MREVACPPLLASQAQSGHPRGAQGCQLVERQAGQQWHAPHVSCREAGTAPAPTRAAAGAGQCLSFANSAALHQGCALLVAESMAEESIYQFYQSTVL